MTQIGAEIRWSVADVDLNPLPASIGLLVRLFVKDAARKPILAPRTKKHGHGLKKTDGLVRSP